MFQIERILIEECEAFWNAWNNNSRYSLSVVCRYLNKPLALPSVYVLCFGNSRVG